MIPLRAPRPPTSPLVPLGPSQPLSSPTFPHVPSGPPKAPHGPSVRLRGAPPPPGGAIARAGGLRARAAIGPCGWGGASGIPAHQGGKGRGLTGCSAQPLVGTGPGRGRGSARRLEAVPGRRERGRDMAAVSVTTEGPVEVSHAAPLRSAWRVGC